MCSVGPVSRISPCDRNLIPPIDSVEQLFCENDPIAQYPNLYDFTRISIGFLSETHLRCRCNGEERFVDRQFESWPELVDPIGRWWWGCNKDGEKDCWK